MFTCMCNMWSIMYSSATQFPSILHSNNYVTVSRYENIVCIKNKLDYASQAMKLASSLYKDNQPFLTVLHVLTIRL